MVSLTSWDRPLFLPPHPRPPSIPLKRRDLRHPSTHTEHRTFSPRQLDSLQSRPAKFSSSISIHRAGDNPKDQAYGPIVTLGP